MKRVIWVGSSYKDLIEFPPHVCHAMGYALFRAQEGKKHEHAKVLSGMGSANILEIRENDPSGTYRVIPIPKNKVIKQPMAENRGFSLCLEDR